SSCCPEASGAWCHDDTIVCHRRHSLHLTPPSAWPIHACAAQSCADTTHGPCPARGGEAHLVGYHACSCRYEHTRLSSPSNTLQPLCLSEVARGVGREVGGHPLVQREAPLRRFQVREPTTDAVALHEQHTPASHRLNTPPLCSVAFKRGLPNQQVPSRSPGDYA